MARIVWHSLSVKESLNVVSSRATGLTSKEVSRRLIKHGPNELTIKTQTKTWKLFFSQFTSPLIYILLIASVITLYLGLFVDAYVIIGVLLINATIGYFQERKAEQSLAQLKKLLSPTARVMRDGVVRLIPANELTVGDIVELTEGSLVPADLRLIQVHTLKVDESILTGESIPTHKQTKAISKEASVVKRTSMTYTGTTVVSGRALGVVIAVGAQTEFGKLAKATQQTTAEETPLEKNLATLSKQLLVIILIAVAFIALIGIFQQRDPLTMFLIAVAAAVSAIPEGLPAIMTIALAVGVRRMAKEKAIVRRLAAIETLGSVTLIASDKTGTLTNNELVVNSFISPGEEVFSFSGSGYDPSGIVQKNSKPISAHSKKYLQEVLLNGVLANDARHSNIDNHWNIVGDPTEGAILVAGKKIDLIPTDARSEFPRVDELPFSSNTRMMLTVHSQTKGANLVSAKGSIETLLKHCSQVEISPGKTVALTQKKLNKILLNAKTYASKGVRVLALASGKINRNSKLSSSNLPKLTYRGFVSMLDTPRPSAIEAIKKAKLAGIKTIMITGDTSPTATAIAQQLQLVTSKKSAISGPQLEKLTVPEFEKTVSNNAVFAEISPQLKLRVLEVFQADGEIVAVTGDGANDAPILKRAHVGIAMGQGGADVARESADIVLADNNFSTIIKAIEQGRTIFTNIQRVIWYLLATNLAELLVLIVSLIVALPLPLLPTQILWINVVTEGTGTIGLAIEPKHRSVLSGRPRPTKEAFINKLMTQRILIVGGVIALIVFILFITTYNRTDSLDYSRSVAFVSLAILQIINLFNARSFTLSVLKVPLRTNWVILVSALASILLTIATVELPFLQSIFQTESLTSSDWIIIILASFSVMLVVEVDKAIRRALKAKQHAR